MMARVLAERYELRRRIAVGGMAEVYEAHDLRLVRDVAVKILRADLPDARARERFEHEARLSAGLDHPNVVTVFDVGEDGARPFIVMELVDGEDLAHRLATSGPLSPNDAVRVLDGVLRALEAAHARGIVHRDVKPGNVLLGRDGRVCLADFGIAKAVAAATADLTMAGQVIGTPRYLAPEQLRGEPATPRSDVYSAGIVLYETLAGPVGWTEGATAMAPSSADLAVTPLVARRPDVPAALAAVADRARSFDPADRFADAVAMRAALGAGRPPPRAVERPGTVVSPPTQVLAATSLQPAARTAHASTPSSTPVAAEPTRRVPVLAVVGAVVVLAGATVLALSALAARDGDAAPVTTSTPATTPERSTTAASAVVVTVPATTARATTTPLATTSTTVRSTSTTARPTTTTTLDVPVSIDQLVQLLSFDTAGFGERAATLLADLKQIRTINPKHKGGRDLRDAAIAELAAIEGWRRQAAIDERIAGYAIDLLRPLVG